MPEGDSYALAASRVRPVLEHRQIVDATGVPAIRRERNRVVGAVATSIRTTGKHLLIDLSSGRTIHVWLGIPGRVVVRTRGSGVVVGERRPGEQGRMDPGSVRLDLTTEAGRVLVASAPLVEIERTHVIDAGLRRLGADVLADPFDWEVYLDRTARVEPDRPLTDVLLDQRVLAGVGNEYKNEILFLERLHPLLPFGSLGEADLRALAGRAVRLMRPNSKAGRRVTTGNRTPGMETWVYGRGGRPCRRCRVPILSDHLGSPPRITFWCPSCQPREDRRS